MTAHRIPLSELEQRHPLRAAPHRPRRRGAGQDARAGRLRLAGRADRRRGAGRHQERRGAASCRRARTEAEVLAELRSLADRNQVLAPDDRPRLLRHLHAAGDPAQRHGEPGLVHGVHAVPAGDLAGPARGAAELPDRGRRADRAAHLRRLPARRGHRRRRGDGAVPPGGQGQEGRLPGRRRHPAADHRRDRDPRRADRRRGRRRRPRRGHPGRDRRARCLRRAAPVPGRLRCRTRPQAASSSRRTSSARSSPSPPTCSP